MITRIVKMSFSTDKTIEFIELFHSVKHKIVQFPGCKGVDLLRDVNNPAVFFTYSKWESINDLENYRHSELFKTTWFKTKQLFNDKAEAWSLMNEN